MTTFSDIPHNSEAQPQVNVPQLTTIYDHQGNEVQVDPALVDYFLRNYGFALRYVDPAGRAAELDALFDGAREAVSLMVRHVTETGAIETHPDAAFVTACAAMEELTQAWGRLYRELQQTYPPAEAPVVQDDSSAHPAEGVE